MKKHIDVELTELQFNINMGIIDPISIGSSHSWVGMSLKLFMFPFMSLSKIFVVCLYIVSMHFLLILSLRAFYLYSYFEWDFESKMYK